MKTLIALSLLALAACAAPSSHITTSTAALETTTFDWPVPEGGAPETIAFPLPFAPEIPYQGRLELRFQPHFFSPEAETYFTYSFVWLLDNGPEFDPARLQNDLVAYYSGLAKGSDPEHFDEAAHRASISRDKGDQFSGTVDTQDGFNQGRPLRLFVVAAPIRCGSKTGLLFSLSPKNFGAPAWQKLYTSSSAFSCSPS